MIPQRYLMFQTSILPDVDISDNDEILTYLPPVSCCRKNILALPAVGIWQQD